MSCSARLPVYALLIARVHPGGPHLARRLAELCRELTLTAMYLVGIVAAIVVALVLKKTLLRGPTPPFVMELPSYKMPAPCGRAAPDAGAGLVVRAAGRHADRRGGHRRLGQSLLSADASVEAPFLAERRELEARLRLPDAAATARARTTRRSTRRPGPPDCRRLSAAEILGRVGRWIEPAVRPLGWDWRIGCAAIASFPAREVVVATLGIIYNLGEVDAADPSGTGLDDGIAQLRLGKGRTARSSACRSRCR